MPPPSTVRWRWTPVVLYMAFIFALSSLTHPPPLPGQSDKQLHALLYGGFAVLVIRALAGGWTARMTIGMVVSTVVIACLYGASDEYHQSFVPNRQSDVFDVVADTVGASIAASACFGWSRVWGRKPSSGPV